jgi:UDP-N-acetylglucosamine acyltransferase
MNFIHPTAIVYPGVILGDNIYIGAYSIIGDVPEHPDRVDPRQFDSDKGVIIEDGVVIREHCTIHSGVDMTTMICEGSYLMSHVHVGHDAYIGDGCVLHTSCVIGGYSMVRDGSRIGLNATLHQRTSLSRGTMVGAQAFVKGHWHEDFRILAGVPAKDIGENTRAKEIYLGQ